MAYWTLDLVSMRHSFDLFLNVEAIYTAAVSVNNYLHGGRVNKNLFARQRRRVNKNLFARQKIIT